MNTYEKLQEKACEDGIEVIDYPFDSDRIKGLYCDDTIAIRKDISTQKEKACVLAEELGHHYTSSGNIIDPDDVSCRKQEFKARLYGYNLRIGLRGIIQAFENDCRNIYEMAEYLDVTEEYMRDALICYKRKYGLYTIIDNYAIYFEPSLAVMKLRN